MKKESLLLREKPLGKIERQHIDIDKIKESPRVQITGCRSSYGSFKCVACPCWKCRNNKTEILKELYEQGKKDADKLTDKEVEKIKQFCFNDGRDSGRIATLKEVLKGIHTAIAAWKLIKKKEPLHPTAMNVLLILDSWEHEYSLKLKEAKGE